MMKELFDKMSEMKESSRYPYTYAYDLIREAGMADSRSDASRWVEIVVGEDAEKKRKFCVNLADQYIAYEAEVEILRARKNLILKEIRNTEATVPNDQRI